MALGGGDLLPYSVTVYWVGQLYGKTAREGVLDDEGSTKLGPYISALNQNTHMR